MSKAWGQLKSKRCESQHQIDAVRVLIMWAGVDRVLTICVMAELTRPGNVSQRTWVTGRIIVDCTLGPWRDADQKLDSREDSSLSKLTSFGNFKNQAPLYEGEYTRRFRRIDVIRRARHV